MLPLYECCVSRLSQAQRVEEVRKQSEVATQELHQKLKNKIDEKLDSAEENRQNQIKSIRLKLQEHVSTRYTHHRTTPSHHPSSPHVLVLKCPYPSSKL